MNDNMIQLCMTNQFACKGPFTLTRVLSCFYYVVRWFWFQASNRSSDIFVFLDYNRIWNTIFGFSSDAFNLLPLGTILRVFFSFHKYVTYPGLFKIRRLLAFCRQCYVILQVQRRMLVSLRHRYGYSKDNFLPFFPDYRIISLNNQRTIHSLFGKASLRLLNHILR